MYVPEKLKLNKFQLVNIPDNRSYFARFGYSTHSVGNYTGEDVALMPKTKVDTFADMEQYDAMKQREENDK